jgi:hemerythrin-like domain-containing protein
LLLGWKIKKGLSRNVPIEEMADYVIHFAREALFPHFDEEENQVLSYLEDTDSFLLRTLEEHAELRTIILRMSIKGLTDKALLLHLAERLEAHIRFEERELFPYIEKPLR